MTKKEFIRDDGVIRNCDSNYAKMNVFEYMYYQKFFLKDFYYGLLECLDLIWDGIKAFGGIIISIIGFIFFPITFLVVSYFRIKHSKKNMAHWNKFFGEEAITGEPNF